MKKINRVTDAKPEDKEGPVLTEEMKAFKQGAIVDNMDGMDSNGRNGQDATATDEQDRRPTLPDVPIKGTATEVKKPDELLMRTYRYKRSSWLKLKMLSDKLTVQQGKLVSLESMVEEGLQLLFKQYGIADVDLTTGFYSEQ